ncbi:hypothetical protein Pmani_024292 [Petrolisthes manimaculis]|uniref:Uncharacterized protein n=1 Tax=Petrolisthes manimaculis TaxID=1843537 RepID=A0AAE1PAE7_9EUCA|nr:hypothetical protein Pmani_024292 [Petrolisthes manimaculis]
MTGTDLRYGCTDDPVVVVSSKEASKMNSLPQRTKYEYSISAANMEGNEVGGERRWEWEGGNYTALKNLSHSTTFSCRTQAGTVRLLGHISFLPFSVVYMYLQIPASDPVVHKRSVNTTPASVKERTQHETF